jgi:hypothetical protein
MNRIHGAFALAFTSILSLACGAPATDDAASASTSAAVRSHGGGGSTAPGCWSDADCTNAGPMMFCATDQNSCGGRGVCTSRGINLMCPNIDTLACGCDGKAYPNACVAHKAGASLDPQPFHTANIDGDTLAEQPWTDPSQTYFYEFTGNGTAQNDSGTFQLVTQPPCMRAQPRCEIMTVAPKTGTFYTAGPFVELFYDDVNLGISVFEAALDCHNTWHLTGDDVQPNMTLTVSTIQP